MYKIIIIAKDWMERAYIGAQLIEEGFEVEGSSNLVEAIRQVREEKAQPDLLILDSRDQRLDKEIVTMLYKLIPDVPLFLIHGVWDSPETLDWNAEVQELSRPVTIGQIVEKVRNQISKIKNGGSYQ